MLPVEPPRDETLPARAVSLAGSEEREPTARIGGRYLLEDKLGEGTAGVVYQALHVGLKRRFAVKVLHPEPAGDELAVARFWLEAETLGRLRHPNIVDVTDFGVDAESRAPYLVMELLAGVSLAERCRAGPLPLAEALALLEPIASALDAAHAAGVLHRDLKPENVLLARNSAGAPAVKVVDFGLAKIAERAWEGSQAPRKDGGASVSGALLGTPHYLAPELILGQEASPASDVYSLGVMAYQMISGRLPFEGSLREVLAAHLEIEPAAPAGLAEHGPEVWEVLSACLAKDPAARPRSAARVVERLRQAAGCAQRRAWWRREGPRRSGLAVLSGAVALAGVIALAPRGILPLERWSQDHRLASAPLRSPDPRIVLVTLDEEPGARAGGGRLLGDRGDEVAEAVERLFAAGARGVGIDLLLPWQWSRSERFSATLLRHSPRLTLAAFAKPGSPVIGTEGVAGLTTVALGPAAAAGLFGLVNVDEDGDGIVRRGRLSFTVEAGGKQPSWAAHLASRAVGSPAAIERPGAGTTFWIDHRIDSGHYPVVPLAKLRDAIEERPDLVRDRLVLLGVGIAPASDDVHRVPAREEQRRYVSGLALQALQVDTLLASLPIRDVPTRWWVGLAAAITVLSAFAALTLRRLFPVLLAAVALHLALVAASFWLFRSAALVLPVSAPLLVLDGGLVLASFFRWLLPGVPGEEVRP